MWIPSKFNVFCLLAVLISIEQGVSASKLAEATQDLCKDKDRDDFELKLRATLLFRNTLILIDEGWLVYKIAHSNINNSYSQLMIDVLGKPLEEEWPAFKDYPKWKDIKPNVVSIYNVDMKNPFLYMFARGIRGVCYNLNTEKFDEDGRPDVKNGTKKLFITDNGPTLFAIQKDPPFVGKHVELWSANGTWLDDGREAFTNYIPIGYLYYTWNRTSPNLKNITVINWRDRNDNPNKFISPDFKFEDVDWEDLPPGFVYEGSFHFFGYKNVYTFAVYPLKPLVFPKGYGIRATNPVTITKVKDYFHCVQLNISGKTFPPGAYTLNPDTASNGIASWIWIVVGGTVLLLIVAIIALLVWYFSLRSKSHQPKGKTSSEALSKHATTATGKQSLKVKDKKK